MSSRTRAADEFEIIRKRKAEIEREEAEAAGMAAPSYTLTGAETAVVTPLGTTLYHEDGSVTEHPASLAIVCDQRIAERAQFVGLGDEKFKPQASAATLLPDDWARNNPLRDMPVSLAGVDSLITWAEALVPLWGQA